MILKGSIFSNCLKLDTNISIITPDMRDEKKPLKVVYLLHPLYCGHSSWVEYSMLPFYSRNCNAVFVMPEVGRSFYYDMRFGGKYFSYVSEELPEICKNVFNISGKRENTFVIGCSMGGYGALKVAFEKPDTYGVCCAISPAALSMKDGFELVQTEVGKMEFKELFGPDIYHDFEAIFGTGFEWDDSYEMINLIDGISTRKNKPELFITYGTEDYLRDDVLKFTKDLNKIGFKHESKEFTGDHDWELFNSSLKYILDKYLI